MKISLKGIQQSKGDVQLYNTLIREYIISQVNKENQVHDIFSRENLPINFYFTSSHSQFLFPLCLNH